MKNDNSQLPFKNRFYIFNQKGKFLSPWSLRTRLKGLLWKITWLLLFRPSPKPMKKWRNFLLRCFGANITGYPFVSSSSKIRMPWNLVLEDHACIGEKAEIYNLGLVTLKAHCVIAQEVYLCTGTHNLSDQNSPLMVAPIIIEEEAFIGVRALILPGVVIGSKAIVGAGSVVPRDVPKSLIVAGNPSKPIGIRRLDQT